MEPAAVIHCGRIAQNGSGRIPHLLSMENSQDFKLEIFSDEESKNSSEDRRERKALRFVF
jgi:hypothetical protein